MKKIETYESFLSEGESSTIRMKFYVSAKPTGRMRHLGGEDDARKFMESSLKKHGLLKSAKLTVSGSRLNVEITGEILKLAAWLKEYAKEAGKGDISFTFNFID